MKCNSLKNTKMFNTRKYKYALNDFIFTYDKAFYTYTFGLLRLNSSVL